MALFNDKKSFFEELEEYGVIGLSKKYGVTHGAIMYYKRKWDRNRKIKKPASYTVCGSIVIAKDVYGREFMFDLEDIDKVSPFQWYVHQDYVKSMEGKKTRLLHRVVTDCPRGMVVDHINHNKSDNRKENLRIATRSQNIQNRGVIPSNTSGTTGVHWHNHTKKWKAEIEVNGKKIYLGVYSEKEDAIKSRKEAEEKYFGEFAYKQ